MKAHYIPGKYLIEIKNKRLILELTSSQAKALFELTSLIDSIEFIDDEPIMNI